MLPRSSELRLRAFGSEYRRSERGTESQHIAEVRCSAPQRIARSLLRHDD